MNGVGLDWGAGNVKLWTQGGGVVLPSQVAVAADGVQGGKAAGLRQAERPLVVRTNGHRFYVGMGAHSWGRPIENLDDGRFGIGAPELRALTYGARSLSGAWNSEDDSGNDSGNDSGDAVWVGVPQSALSTETAAAVRGWLRGEHVWWLGELGEEQQTWRVGEVTVTSQAAAALFDFLLDETGEFVPERKGLYKREVGVLSVGMNTLEGLVIEAGQVKERFTFSESAGVRRLLEFVDPAGLYSRGELDTLLRTGGLDLARALPVWASEVTGRLEARWGKAARRFAQVIVVGGGAGMLLQSLTTALEGRVWVPEMPVESVARGLWKMQAQQLRRQRSKRGQ